MLVFAIDDEPALLSELHDAIAAAAPGAEIMDFKRAADALEGFHILSAHEKRALREKMQHREDGLGAVRMAKAVRELLSEATG